jgi:hypothetical protein
LPLKHDNSLEATVIMLATIDLELVRLNSYLILPLPRIFRIRIEAAPPLSLFCSIRNTGWLYSGLVARNKSTADAESSAPSFEVKEAVAMASSCGLALSSW